LPTKRDAPQLPSLLIKPGEGELASGRDGGQGDATLDESSGDRADPRLVGGQYHIGRESAGELVPAAGATIPLQTTGMSVFPRRMTQEAGWTNTHGSAQTITHAKTLLIELNSSIPRL